LFDIIEAMREYIPENRIGVRLNPSSHFYHGMTIDKETIPTFDHIIGKLNNYNIAYLHLSEPFTDVKDIPYSEPNIAERYRKIYKGTLMINRGFTAESGNEIIKDNIADLVSFGIPFIANPDFVSRISHNIPLATADKKTYYTPGAKGYTDYPPFNNKG
jgi:N-ethylmaleimide reductase